MFLPLFNVQCPQNNGIALPPHLPLVATPLHTPLHPGHLFWVGCCVSNHQLASVKGHDVFYIIYFLSINSPHHPRAPPPMRLCSNIPSTTSADYWVDCWLSSSIGSHLRPRPRLPLYFLMSLGLAPQTRQPTAAPPNPTTCTLPKPIGSGGTMTWWCRWPIHGGRGLKPVEGRAAWLMLVVVSCCEDKKTLLEHLIVL